MIAGNRQRPTILWLSGNRVGPIRRGDSHAGGGGQHDHLPDQPGKLPARQAIGGVGAGFSGRRRLHPAAAKSREGVKAPAAGNSLPLQLKFPPLYRFSN